MTSNEYLNKLNTFSKEVLVNYIFRQSINNIKNTLLEIECIERDINYQTYNRMYDEAMEEIKTSTSLYVEFLDSLKKKYGKESLSLRDLTLNEVEKLSKLQDNIDIAQKKFNKVNKRL